MAQKSPRLAVPPPSPRLDDAPSDRDQKAVKRMHDVPVTTDALNIDEQDVHDRDGERGDGGTKQKRWWSGRCAPGCSRRQSRRAERGCDVMLYGRRRIYRTHGVPTSGTLPARLVAAVGLCRPASVPPVLA